MRRRRQNPSFFETIEYIGPRPQKPRRKAPSFLGGWVLMLIAASIAYFFGKPLMPFLRAQQDTASVERADLLISRMMTSPSLGERLAAAALQQTKWRIAFDNSYRVIGYPGGDIPADRGYGPDVVVRAFRAVGIDLQRLVHEDMSAHFKAYPDIFNATKPDPNIDHRRVANLERFFKRHGEELSATRHASDYAVGDIVIWRVGSQKHIGILVPAPGDRPEERWVVHNLDRGPVWGDDLADFEVIGHYRYGGDPPAARAGA